MFPFKSQLRILGKNLAEILLYWTSLNSLLVEWLIRKNIVII